MYRVIIPMKIRSLEQISVFFQITVLTDYPILHLIFQVDRWFPAFDTILMIRQLKFTELWKFYSLILGICTPGSLSSLCAVC